MRIPSTVLLAFAVLPYCHSRAHAADETPAKRITAADVIERIHQHAGVPVHQGTVDTFKAGSQDTPVTGIATSFAATYDVLERAAASGKNLIIAHEPTFYNHTDETKDLLNDPVYQQKVKFIADHHMIVWRFHDGWHERSPDGIRVGMVQALGWERFETPSHLYALPATSLQALATQIRDRLKIRTLRVIGDPSLNITLAAFLPGAAGSERQIKALEREDVNLLIVGESREWETVEYVRDAASEGRKKALIIMGHVPSEEAGMQECARWLRTFVKEVPVEYIPAGEPFWTPR